MTKHPHSLLKHKFKKGDLYQIRNMTLSDTMEYVGIAKLHERRRSYREFREVYNGNKLLFKACEATRPGGYKYCIAVLEQHIESDGTVTLCLQGQEYGDSKDDFIGVERNGKVAFPRGA